MYRNEIFELIRASQIEDNVIFEGSYWKCYHCKSILDVYIKAYDSSTNNSIHICKDCFCKSDIFDYCVPFSYLGESGYFMDNISNGYLYNKYKTHNVCGKCYSCNIRTNYGVFAHIHKAESFIKPLEHVFLCKDCFTSQGFVNEDLFINWFKKKGIKVFNESKQKNRK